MAASLTESGKTNIGSRIGKAASEGTEVTAQQRYLLRILTDSYKFCVDITEAIAPPATVEKLAYRKVKKILQELIVSDGIKASPTACQIMTNISEQRK